MADALKPLYWVGTAREDLRTFPEEVRLSMGYSLFLAQAGGKHPDAKPMKGLGGAGVLEVVEDFDGDTYRAVYTVKIAGAIFVLHAFQKKARRGIKTDSGDLELVKKRLRAVMEQFGN